MRQVKAKAGAVEIMYTSVKLKLDLTIKSI